MSQGAATLPRHLSPQWEIQQLGAPAPFFPVDWHSPISQWCFIPLLCPLLFVWACCYGERKKSDALRSWATFNRPAFLTLTTPVRPLLSQVINEHRCPSLQLEKPFAGWKCPLLALHPQKSLLLKGHCARSSPCRPQIDTALPPPQNRSRSNA